MFWIVRRALRVGLTALLVAGASARVLAEQDARQPRESGPFFVGGAFLLSSAHGATQDPPGYGYLRPYFHGSPHWPAPGAMLAGGVFVGEDWSVAGEFAFRRSATATVSEESRTHFEFSQVSSVYTHQERLFSAVVGRQLKLGSSVELHPLGGLTISRGTQALTNRQSRYTYFAGTILSRLPDVAVDTTAFGVVGGADLLFRLRSGVSLACAARVHWLHRPDDESERRDVPRLDPYEVQIGAGIRWRPHRRGPRR